MYILGSDSGTLYIGVTNNVARRMFEHKNHLIKGFTEKYDCTKLLYFEESNSIESAIIREKQLKGWKREKKISLIKSTNPGWRDLGNDFQLERVQ